MHYPWHTFSILSAHLWHTFVCIPGGIFTTSKKTQEQTCGILTPEDGRMSNKKVHVSNTFTTVVLIARPNLAVQLCIAG